MIKSLTEVAAEEQFLTKSLANNVIKLVCTTPETYRAIIKHCKEQNIYYHTYQLKEDRAFQVVIKHLHHTTDLDDIKNELQNLGHDMRNIINVKHRQIKEPLNTFFIDLEPAKNNKDIYEVKAIQNKLIQIEPPRSTKPHIPQCIRCQQYGQTVNIVTNHLTVSNAEDITTALHALSPAIPQQNVPCVEDHTRQTTKGVNNIIIS